MLDEAGNLAHWPETEAKKREVAEIIDAAIQSRSVEERAKAAAEGIQNDHDVIKRGGFNRDITHASVDEIAVIITRHFAGVESGDGKWVTLCERALRRIDFLNTGGLDEPDPTAEELRLQLRARHLQPIDEALGLPVGSFDAKIALASAPAPSGEQEKKELVEAMARLMKCSSNLSRLEKVSTRDKIEEGAREMMDAEMECWALLRKHGGQS